MRVFMRVLAKFIGIDVRNRILRGLVLLLTLACSGTLVHAQSRKQNESTKGKQISDIFRNGPPYGLIQFNVPNVRDSAQPPTSRLAVLDSSGLHIYKFKGTKQSELVQDFALTQPAPETGAEPWDTLEAFPSHYALPGVVLWASTDVSYSIGTVVCYVEGEPRVIFRGQYFDFAHITLDDIPEILVEQGVGFEASIPPKAVIVWTWNGRRYVKVEEVPVDRLYSQDVVKAIRAARDKK